MVAGDVKGCCGGSQRRASSGSTVEATNGTVLCSNYLNDPPSLVTLVRSFHLALKPILNSSSGTPKVQVRTCPRRTADVIEIGSLRLQREVWAACRVVGTAACPSWATLKGRLLTWHLVILEEQHHIKVRDNKKMIIQPDVKNAIGAENQSCGYPLVPPFFSSPAVSQSVSANSAHSIAELTRTRKEIQHLEQLEQHYASLFFRSTRCRLVSRSLPQVNDNIKALGLFHRQKCPCLFADRAGEWDLDGFYNQVETGLKEFSGTEVKECGKLET